MSPGTSLPDVRCRSCGASLPADSTFCVFCGAAVVPEMLGLHCTACNRALGPDAHFCPDCGTSVEPAPAISPTPAPEPTTGAAPGPIAGTGPGPVVPTAAPPPPQVVPAPPPQPPEAVRLARQPLPIPSTPSPRTPTRDADVDNDVEVDVGAADEPEEPLDSDPVPAPSVHADRRPSPPQPPAPETPRRSSGPLIGVALVAIAVAGAAAFFFLSPKRSILRHAAAGNLVQPEGSSAYDLFLTYNAGHPSAQDLADIDEAVGPALKRRGEEIITRLKQENVDAEADWAEAARIYAWLSLLEPTPTHQSRQRFSQGRLRFLKGENSTAIADFQSAIQMDAGWALPWNSLARVYLRMSDRQSAQQHYRRATELEPSWIFPWLNLGSISYELKDYATTEWALRRALTLDPARASAHYYLARSLDDLKRYCDAIPEYASALDNAFRTNRPGFNIDAARNRRDKLAAKYSCR